VRYRTIGRTGLSVSEIGFGGAPAGIPQYLEPWDADGATERDSVIRAIRRGLDLGLNYLDTAPGYGGGVGEEIYGEAIRGRREEVVLATKTSARDPDGIIRSVEESLCRLGTDHLDVLQFHGGWYPPEDVEKTLRRGGLETYQHLREQGKVRFLGFTAEGPSGGVSELITTDAFDVLQCRYNLFRTLTSGLFQKLMRHSFPEVAARLPLDCFLLNFVLSNPLVDVALVGMRRPEEVEANNALSDDEASRLDLAALHVRHLIPTGSER
jgi:aryl-alcohol dehydrogenase-like predicted oxidoreductase